VSETREGFSVLIGKHGGIMFVVCTFTFERWYRSVIPGDSVVRGPKLLSIKTYVIEIMT
jgi:hypothetical protein